MASRKRNTRSSVTPCQENFSCRDANSEATVQCLDCKSYQCESCDISLHTTERHRYHDRITIKKADPKELCQEGQSSQCLKQNYSDVWCEECKSGFCYTCDGSRHRQKRRLHNRKPFEIKINENYYTEKIVEGLAVLNVNEGGSDLIPRTQPQMVEDDSFHSLSFMQNGSPIISDTGNRFMSSQHSNGSKTSLPDIIDDMVDHQFYPSQENGADEFNDVNGFLLVDTNECLQVSGLLCPYPLPYQYLTLCQ